MDGSDRKCHFQNEDIEVNIVAGMEHMLVMS